MIREWLVKDNDGRTKSPKEAVRDVLCCLVSHPYKKQNEVEHDKVGINQCTRLILDSLIGIVYVEKRLFSEKVYSSEAEQLHSDGYERGWNNAIDRIIKMFE